MFVVVLTYTKPLEEVDQNMQAHMKYLRECYKKKLFITSGRRVPRTGGVILARAENKAALTQVIERDPFVARGVARYEIIEFNNSQNDPDFKAFLQS